MEFTLTEEQEVLAKTARRFLEERSPTDKVREVMTSEDGYDPALWSEVAQMGWQAMAIPEEYGGAGYGFTEVSVLLEEMGRALFPSPFLASAVLAADAILRAGSEEQKQTHLPPIASGETIGSLALLEESDVLGPEGIACEARRDGDGWVLNGTKRFVPAGNVADLLVVAARTGGADGVTLFLVPTDVAGVSAESLDVLDLTRHQADVEFADVRVPAANLLGEEGAGWPILATVLETGAVALACEQVGAAQWCLRTSTQYAKTRMQFGRPIGSFQAVKHRLADMLVQSEAARSAAYYAARVLAGEAEDADEREPTIAAHLAASYCADVLYGAAADTIQIHGGIGFTWEHDAHLYFKRAKSSQLMLGDSEHHRRLLAEALGY